MHRPALFIVSAALGLLGIDAAYAADAPVVDAGGSWRADVADLAFLRGRPDLAG